MRILAVCVGVVVGLIVVGLAAAAVIGPTRFLDWAGYSVSESRLVTGIVVTGTPESPVVYVTSSDPRLPAEVGQELPTDTNSGVISVLSRESGQWRRRDLVQGLPRSRLDHAVNGLAYDRDRERLYVAQGSMTNMGAPSTYFGHAPEYALSGAILEIDLRTLGDEPYALPTLDDDTRSGSDDAGDPFGGNDGRNQAVVPEDGPVRLVATGFRNPYDVVLSRTGRVYTIDNAPNWFLGGTPATRDETCTNAPTEGGRYGPDVLYLVEDGDYFGHPNPARSSTTVTFNESAPQAAVQEPRPEECRYTRGTSAHAITPFETSTNGLAEYDAAAYGGALRGDLIAASFDRRVYRVELDASGEKLVRKTPLAELEGYPLDVTTQHDTGPFAGTIWVVDWLSGDVFVLEPSDRRAVAHWESLRDSGFPRQEVSWVRAGDRFYLTGGDRRQEEYDPATDTWRDVAPLPERLDHIQGVAVGGRIYYIGGLRDYPQPAVGTVSIYDPRTDTFTRGAPMPRPRGAGGVAVHDGKIYYAGGLADGKAVAWFDVYDPARDRWSQLPDMPRVRDHFQAQVVGARFYAIGGRDSSPDANIGDNDAFDLVRNRWITGLAPLPTPRGGYASAVVGDEIVVFGGESAEQVFAEAEAYDVRRNSWRVLDPMSLPRHGIQAIACGGDVYIAAGGAQPFGGAPSAANSVYVSRPNDRCDLAHATRGAAGNVRFRVARVPAGLVNPTSLQFGPDGRLYVSEQNGSLKAFTVHRTDEGRYEILAAESIESVREIPNHDDDGSSVESWSTLASVVGRRLGVCCSYPVTARPLADPSPATAPGDPQRGRTLFRDADCAGCHALASAGSEALAGPPLDRAWRLSADYVEQSILDPEAVIAPGYPAGLMPPDYGMTLSEQQLRDVVAFVRSRPGGR